MTAWRLVGEAAWPIAVNWKVVVDGFSEDYHADEHDKDLRPIGVH